MRNEDLQLFVRQLNECLQTTGNALWAESVCCLYRSHTGAGVLLTNRAGEAVAQAVSEREGEGSAARKTGGNTNSALLTLFAYTNGTPIGTLTLSRSGEFDGNEKTAAEVMLGLFTVLLVQIEERMTRERKRRQRGVRDVINSLSYSELMAATRVIKMLGGEEGVLVAGRVADALKIARSVVASTLRKLEGAGMIETRSLGMKGTYIKVKDGLLAGELGKIG